VACASILAKVERDRRMEILDAAYPHYGFRSNKGYAAPEHLGALREHGPSPLHRLTFGSVLPKVCAA
jgi:ribonuclease HII